MVEVEVFAHVLGGRVRQIIYWYGSNVLGAWYENIPQEPVEEPF